MIFDGHVKERESHMYIWANVWVNIILNHINIVILVWRFLHGIYIQLLSIMWNFHYGYPKLYRKCEILIIDTPNGNKKKTVY